MTYKESQKKYEQSEKGRARKRAYMKRRRQNPKIRDQEATRDRREYQRKYYQQKKAESKAQQESYGS